MIKTICALALALALCAPATNALERGKSKAKAASSKLGVVDLIVVDENDKIIPGVDVSINGKTIRGNPFSHRAGKFKVRATSEVGEATSEVTIKADEITRISLKFFRLRETVTRLVSVPAERYHGTIIFLNCLGNDTEVFVDRKEGERTDGFDGRVSKGSGSLKISNLAVGTYELEVRRKDGDPVQGCAGGCKTEVPLRKGEIMAVKADGGGVQRSATPLACGTARKRTATEK